MSFLITHTGNSIDVQAIIAVQPLNGLSGLAARSSRKRTAAPCGFFVCDVQLHLSMVGRTGEPKGSPGSFVTGPASPVRLTTNQSLAAPGGDFKITKGVQP
ncbi:ash family protein [Serratia proteamaculans]|uniref:Ash family protein n=1 Tax=Serratia proteamaculans TaxID=28151 RepID=A0ABS0TRZ5_SERPR|nr:ash family protein [Serratia proteamaculans]MBI6181110.1 ash family protein [Serratia proteamaculans]